MTVDFTYKWAEGSRHKVDPNVAAKVTKELEEKGLLTAQALVNVSRDEDAPLHDEFEWNDDVAAEQYRLTQARGVIRHLVVVRPESKTPERVFVNVHIEQPEYTTLRKALSIKSEREIVLERARRDATIFMEKYKSLEELAGVLDAMEEFMNGQEVVA